MPVVGGELTQLVLDVILQTPVVVPSDPSPYTNDGNVTLMVGFAAVPPMLRLPVAPLFVTVPAATDTTVPEPAAPAGPVAPGAPAVPAAPAAPAAPVEPAWAIRPQLAELV